jgi:hypothetical protein
MPDVRPQERPCVEKTCTQELFMNYKRLSALAASAGLAVLLSGCVVAPIDPGPVAVYPSRPVYVQPAPIVVAPAPGYYYRPYRYRHWR